MKICPNFACTRIVWINECNGLNVSNDNLATEVTIFKRKKSPDYFYISLYIEKLYSIVIRFETFLVFFFYISCCCHRKCLWFEAFKPIFGRQFVSFISHRFIVNNCDPEQAKYQPRHKFFDYFAKKKEKIYLHWKKSQNLFEFIQDLFESPFIKQNYQVTYCLFLIFLLLFQHLLIHFFFVNLLLLLRFAVFETLFLFFVCKFILDFVT